MSPFTGALRELLCGFCLWKLVVGQAMIRELDKLRAAAAFALDAQDVDAVLAILTALEGERITGNAQLGNVALRAPYFHSGQAWSLNQAVGVMGASQLWAKLTDNEEDGIVAFLGS